MDKRKIRILSVMLSCLVLAGATVVLANGGFDLLWWTVDGGGATFSTGGPYTLGGTAGQPDAGVTSGGDYTLSGGFWGPGGMYFGYLPVVMK